jgi:hypothetical protein
MKSFISNLVIASILSITLVTLIDSVPHISQKYLSYRAAKTQQVQSGPDIPGHSYGEVLNNLFSSFGR